MRDVVPLELAYEPSVTQHDDAIGARLHFGQTMRDIDHR